MFRRNSVNLAALIALGAAVAPLALLAPQTALAQSNATGSIYGAVTAGPGTTVVVENPATGFKRTATPDANGRIQVTSLPVGVYRVSLMRDGKAIKVQEGVEVRLGQGSEVFLTTALETVTVTARRKTLDVSNADSGATFSAAQLDALPTGRNLAAIIALAPNTTNADPRYPGGASIGGGAASENSYYINGFPVTNPLNQLGSSELPFGAIDQAQVLNGGFGAEFGRSVGGVISIITKSGTNEWEYGASASTRPASFRQSSVDRYYAKVGVASTDGKLRLLRHNNSLTENVVGGYVGGPILKDRLFMFISAERKIQNTESIDPTNGNTSVVLTSKTSGWNSDHAVTDRVLGKFDLNIADGHKLDLTLIKDTPKLTRTVKGVDPSTGVLTGTTDHVEKWQNDEDGLTSSGANTSILRYIGEITNDLTMTAVVGRSVTTRKSSITGSNIGVPSITFENGVSSQAPGVSYPVANTFTGQLYRDGNKDTVKGLRLDFEYRLGAHTLKAGLDDNKMSTRNGGKEAPPQGRSIQYRNLSPADTANKNFTLSDTGSQVFWLGDPAHGALATQGFYGVETIISTVSNAYSNQSAQYIEDKYQVTKNLVLTAGLRRETYENRNQDDVSFLKISNQYNPRFSAVWDAKGDASMKVFGSAGRYSIQIPTLIALRGANGSLFTSQAFSYTGVDANGQPVGRANLTTAHSNNNEYGQAKDPRSVAATNMKPAYQDELMVGIENALLPDLNGGVKFTYRALKSTIDDMCDPRAFIKYAADHNIDTTNWGGFACASFNPGRANSFDINYAGDGKTYTRVNLSAAELGFDKPKRTYTALDFFLEHPLRNGWYGKVTYTYSKSKGNTEGQTLSDRAQRDVSATMTWDMPELMENAYGYLPNDRRHQLKAYGFVNLGKEWQVGGVMSFESGRPRSCLGTYQGDPAHLQSINDNGINYGSNYHYCFGKASPRGTVGNLPSNSRIDLSLTYKPEIVPGLAVTAEVFNLNNNQTVLAVEERGETNSGARRNIYELPVGNAAPRNMRFSVTYNKPF
ncbi:TonB-dependent receptor plug domain-containing protein [Pelomonas sp. P7]|uniref:TonB-dependent receptor plug domain-containing protein n=1 Tax=Pelomonas caseinilytica TaxID=2906763 RepID=A0ABS8XE27_9BURK|nr:TonB-dependent receptor [Pelomonas sp. P7]MCE4539162.1 TonB-dependent receptor plug domain-containing protein [Pelomonas sp. P7]